MDVGAIRLPAAFDAAAWYNKNAAAHTALWADVGSPELERFAGEVPAGAVVADIACGGGRHLTAGQQLGLRMVGSDISVEQISLAASTGVPVVCASFTDLPYRDSSVDAVWACAALVHCADGTVADALVECGRVIRPGGLLFASVKSADALDADGFDSAGRWFRLWDAQTIAAVASRAGWEVLEVAAAEDAVRPHVRWLNMLARWPS
jgi:SAM-dependent methyltransferase